MLLSDDGCNVFIDGRQVVSRKDTGQALLDLAHSLVPIDVTLQAGRAYHIRVEYSNTQFTLGGGDIDGAVLFAYAANDSSRVLISSDIQQSWRKNTGAGATKYPANVNVRDIDGSMTVDSVMELQAGSGYPASYWWKATPTFTATQNKFSRGKYEWNGDIGNADRGSAQYEESQNPNGNQNSVTHCFGWAGNQGETLPATSQERNVTVKVTDAEGKVAGELQSLTYKVRYHLPVENKEEDKSRSRSSSNYYDRGVSSWTPVNKPVTILLKPANRTIVFLTKGGGALFSVAGAIVGTASIFASGGSAAPLAPYVVGSLTAIGIGLDKAAPEDETYPENFSYERYTDAVNNQHKIDNPQLYGNKDIPAYRRVWPETLTNVAKAGLTDATRADFDPTWKNSYLKGRIITARKSVTYPMIGDGYNKNGYNGRQQWDDTIEETHMYINQIWLPKTSSDPEPDVTANSNTPTE